MASANDNGGVSTRVSTNEEKEITRNGTAALVLPIPSPIGARDLQLEAAVAEAGEHPERAAELAADLGLSHADVKQVAQPETVESLLGAVGREMEEQESARDDEDDDEDDEEDDGCEPWKFRNLLNVDPTDVGLEIEAGNSVLLSLVLAFCSAAGLPHGQSPDITAEPHRTNRTVKNPAFRINSDAFRFPTASGWLFRKGDQLGIWGLEKGEDYYSPHDVVLILKDDDLTLCEVREDPRLKDKEGDPIKRLFNLRDGLFLTTNAYLIIGELWDVRRRYDRLKNAPFDRAYERWIAESLQESEKSKRKDAGSAYERKERLDRYILEEEAKDAAVAQGGVR